MPPRLPAVSLAAVPGRRKRTLELAAEIEDRGFSGIYGPSFGDVLSLCVSLAHVTGRVPFGTAIQPIYARTAKDVAATASYVAEVSDGRFTLGLGVSHGGQPTPLADMRAYVGEVREAVGDKPMPRLVLAALRTKMVRLAVELADGAVWANAARSHMGASLDGVPDGFWVGNMIPTVVDDDREAAAAVNRRTLTGYVGLPNYRNYWKEAGYVEEMDAIEKAIADGRRDDVPKFLTDRWLADNTLFGPPAKVRDGLAAWRAAGVHTPILVPSSAAGNQLKAIDEVFAAFK
jgi:alkanesulfonate monooxygenase SsuD/methylene tetrahydromethanopterin reductase-like flavin-dependent oxidoreductase (luciferase family)